MNERELGSKGMVEKFFLTISSAELFMGLLWLCNVRLPMSRFILWGFLFSYTVIVLLGHYSFREKLILGVLLAFGILLYINSGLNTGIKAPIYLYALKDVDKRKYCKVSLWILIATFLGIALASVFAGFGSLYYMDIRANRGFAGMRYCFGFPHPNRTMAVVFIMMMLFLHLYVDKMKWYGFLILAALYTVFFYLTDSRTAFHLGMFIMILSFCVQHVRWKRWNLAVFVLFLFTFTSMLLISVLAACHYESDWMSVINHIISGRMSQLGTYPGDESYALPYVEHWRLFGSRVNQGGYDMGYVQVFYYYGIVPAVCYLAFTVYAAVCAWKNEKTQQLVLLLGFCAYLFMEIVYFSNFIPMNFQLTYEAVIVWGTYEREERKNISGNFVSLYNC